MKKETPKRQVVKLIDFILRTNIFEKRLFFLKKKLGWHKAMRSGFEKLSSHSAFKNEWWILKYRTLKKYVHMPSIKTCVSWVNYTIFTVLRINCDKQCTDGCCYCILNDVKGNLRIEDIYQKAFKTLDNVYVRPLPSCLAVLRLHQAILGYRWLWWHSYMYRGAYSIFS